MRHWDPVRNRRAALSPGFTLVELIVVLALMLLAAAVAVPSFIRFQQAWQLQWAARRTQALAAEARGIAVSRDVTVELTYDPAAQGMRLTAQSPDVPAAVAGDDANRPEPPVRERLTPDARLLEFPLDVKVTLAREDGSPARALRFFGDGRADPVTVRLEREDFPPIVLETNGRTSRLTVRKERP